jgi:aerobic carbon-monoxide dehydrogenase large subunit
VLFEQTIYDENGQLLTGEFMDYPIARATDIPEYQLGSTVTPSPSNPMGIKGVGEAGTIGATPAIANAVMDALSPLGVRHLDLPLTPQKVWKAIQEGSGQGPGARLPGSIEGGPPTTEFTAEDVREGELEVGNV